MRFWKNKNKKDETETIFWKSKIKKYLASKRYFGIISSERGGSSMLDGFKQYNMAVGTSSVSITDNGIAFSKAAIVRIGKPEYVIFMIDE